MNKKKREQRKLIIGGVVVLFLLGAVIALASQLGMFKGYLGSKASICSNNGTYCPGGSCPDGWSYGSDDCYVGISCAQRAVDGCVGHQGSGGGGTGGGGGGCDGSSSNSICKGRCNPGSCDAPDGTHGNCYVVTPPNNCGWSPSSSTPPATTKAPTVTAAPSPKPSVTLKPTVGCVVGSSTCENKILYDCDKDYGWVTDGKSCPGSTTPNRRNWWNSKFK